MSHTPETTARRHAMASLTIAGRRRLRQRLALPPRKLSAQKASEPGRAKSALPHLAAAEGRRGNSGTRIEWSSHRTLAIIVSRSSSREPDEAGYIHDKRSRVTTWLAFLQSTVDYDFLAKELAILLSFLRHEGELQSGQVLVLRKASWPPKLQVPARHWPVAARQALVIRRTRRNSVHEMARKLPLAPREAWALICRSARSPDGRQNQRGVRKVRSRLHGDGEGPLRRATGPPWCRLLQRPRARQSDR